MNQGFLLYARSYNFYFYFGTQIVLGLITKSPLSCLLCPVCPFCYMSPSLFEHFFAFRYEKMVFYFPCPSPGTFLQTSPHFFYCRLKLGNQDVGASFAHSFGGGRSLLQNHLWAKEYMCIDTYIYKHLHLCYLYLLKPLSFNTSNFNSSQDSCLFSSFTFLILHSLTVRKLASIILNLLVYLINP